VVTRTALPTMRAVASSVAQLSRGGRSPRQVTYGAMPSKLHVFDSAEQQSQPRISASAYAGLKGATVPPHVPLRLVSVSTIQKSV
jgi:hypothetical protein